MGADLRLRIRARDVSIARQPVTGLSIRNQLPARIETVRTDDKGYAELVLRLGEDGAGAGLRSRITAASVRDLQLSPGDLVFALVKSIAIERRLLQPMSDVSIAASQPQPISPDKSPETNTGTQENSKTVPSLEVAAAPVEQLAESLEPDSGDAKPAAAPSQADSPPSSGSAEPAALPDEDDKIETEAESDPDIKTAPDQTSAPSPGSEADTAEPEAKPEPEPNPFLMKSPTIKPD